MKSARNAGASRKRLRAGDLQTPFHGIREPRGTQGDLVNTCTALATTFRSGDAFTGATAARLWRMPLPRRLNEEAALYVSTLLPLQRIRREGVVGTRRTAGEPVRIHGVPVLEPGATWVSLATLLSTVDLTAIGDFLVTGDRGRDPLLDIQTLNDTVSRAKGVPGISRLREAVIDVRAGSWSRPETQVRLLLVGAGIPEPSLNVTLTDADGYPLTPDLGWPEFRVAIEYNGWHHESSRNRIADVRRLDRYADIGWSAMAVDRSQLYGSPSDLVARCIRRLVERGWSGTSTIEWPILARFEP